MTASNFQACLAVILKSEGGYTVDSGGPTQEGITLRTLSAYLGRPATVEELKALPTATRDSIYRTDYFNFTRCDALPNGIDLIVFDCAVNSGPGVAARTLQTALSVPIDGVIGSVTLAAAAASSVGKVIDRWVTLRAAEYHGYKEWSVDGAGWMNRLYRTAAIAHEMVCSAPTPVGVPLAAPAPTQAPVEPLLAAQPAPQEPPVVQQPDLQIPPAPVIAIPAPTSMPSTPPVVTPARVGVSVAGAGLLAGATAITQVHIVDLKSLIDLCFTYIVAPVAAGVVAGLATQLAQLLHVNIQSAFGQRLLTAAENGASAVVSKANTLADQHSVVMTKSDAVASVINYVRAATPDAVSALGLNTVAGQAHLENLVEGKIQQQLTSTPTGAIQ